LKMLSFTEQKTFLPHAILYSRRKTATMKKSKERAQRVGSRGKRKLSKDALLMFPHEIVGVFARLPKVFKKLDVDRLLGDTISRSMKWRYVRRMETLGLVRHITKKYYRKIYDNISDWIEKDVVPRIRRAESLEYLQIHKS